MLISIARTLCASAVLAAGVTAAARGATPASPPAATIRANQAQVTDLGSYARRQLDGNTLTIVTTHGQTLRLRTYGAGMLRVQAAPAGQPLHPDDYYHIVVNHHMGGTLRVSEHDSYLDITTAADGHAAATIALRIAKSPLRLTFLDPATGQPLLTDASGITWDGGHVATHFVPHDYEHFTGLGHPGRNGLGFKPGKGITRLDLRGERIANYHSMGRLDVPFYLSSKGYGVYYNIVFPWTFSFAADGVYGADFDGLGDAPQMDYFFIAGPSFATILDRYTQLTGRPRLPRLAAFGLSLSDNDGPWPRDETYWKQQITEIRTLGWGFDNAIFDNDWRAAAAPAPGIKPQAGGWSGSQFKWRSDYYPDPAEFGRWLAENGVTLTLDLNRNIVKSCAGWDPSFNVPGQKDWPDLSSPPARDWLWRMMWEAALNPALCYPGDCIWLDEMEWIDGDPQARLANGRKIGEMRNYSPMLIGEAVVADGWDNQDGGSVPGLDPAKRPWVWSRAASAGAQRYLTYWTGDIPFSYETMRAHVIALQRAGLSGFPYFNHDAGGFGMFGTLDDAMYQQWAMAWGSFTPIWRPHGYGEPRWPQRRSAACQEVGLRYDRLRYELMPYIYSCAYEAHETGMPMARPMVMAYTQDERAWQHDMQYMWGPALLVAPNCSGAAADVPIWLPPDATWYDYWSGAAHRGGQVISYHADLGVLPVLVRAGAILPSYQFAASTAFYDRSQLIVDIYAGHDGTFTLYEDDGVSERYSTRGEKRLTRLDWNDQTHTLTVHQAEGTYKGAPASRSYVLRVHGLTEAVTSVELNDRAMARRADAGDASSWQGDGASHVWTVHAASTPTDADTTVRLVTTHD